MTEETPQRASIQARIAALNLSQVGKSPDAAPSYRTVSTPGPRLPPSLPLKRPSIDQRRKTA
ncbi:MAG: hypothetical protein M1830_006848, partial [Pleopsidium flavum]